MVNILTTVSDIFHCTVNNVVADADEKYRGKNNSWEGYSDIGYVNDIIMSLRRRTQVGFSMEPVCEMFGDGY